ncbi:MAG: sensor histidine kinase [Firmicutes bacterium HGW-Firmicutes-1]|jgi:two-component system sensor histidine kinase YesM|nr:MAG: sensor histidine kinase [Firmicutes bacterium HGW-Firmicutes-1]
MIKWKTHVMSKGYSIQYIIAISTIIVAILPMIYTGLSIYEKYSDQIIENSKVYTGQIMEQLKINIDDYLAQGITSHSDVENLLMNNTSENDTSAITNLNMYYSSRNDIVSISLFHLDGTLMNTVPNLPLAENIQISKEDWYQNVIDQNSIYFVSDPHIQRIIQGQYKWVVSICKVVDFGGANTEKKAILVVDMSLQPLVELCDNLNLGGSGYVYIVNEVDEIIYHPQQAVVFSRLKEEISYKYNEQGETYRNSQGDEVLIVNNSLNFVNWDLIGVSYIKNISDRNVQIAKEIMVTIPIILIIVVLLSWYISYKISLPIKELGNHMKIVEKGNFDIQLDLKNGELEVMNLTATFNIMVKRIKELIDENKKEQEAKRHNELNVLQAQINPHFLYNTLDSIMWMAEAGMSEDVVLMVTALAKLFRISISKGQNIIAVEEELEHAKNYLLIQKIRYKEKFNFSIYASDEVKALKTVKLILQPVIENAIYHGIEYMVDLGEIDIYAEIVGGKLLYTVKDNGLGMTPEVLESIRKGTIEVNPNKGGSGVGVSNVNQRIKLRYGNEYGMEITSEEEVGTEVKIWLPIIRGE